MKLQEDTQGHQFSSEIEKLENKYRVNLVCFNYIITIFLDRVEEFEGHYIFSRK